MPYFAIALWQLGLISNSSYTEPSYEMQSLNNYTKE